MKKLLAVLLVILLLVSLAACGKGKTDPTDGSTTGNTQQNTNPTADGTTPSGTTPDGTTPDGTTPDGTAPDETTPDGTAPDETTPDGTTPSQPSGETQPSHTHSYSLTQTVDSTCKDAGKKVFSCSCGNSYTETLPVNNNHILNYSNMELLQSPSPLATGSIKSPCIHCGKAITETIPKLSAEDAFLSQQLTEMVTGKEKNEQNLMTGQNIVAFVIAVGEERTVTQSSGEFFAQCEKFFALTDDLKAEMKAINTETFSYNAGADTFTYITSLGEGTVIGVDGYYHNGGNKYTVYYYAANCECGLIECRECLNPYHFKAELEFLRVYNDKNSQNRILSVTKVSKIPDDLTI